MLAGRTYFSICIPVASKSGTGDLELACAVAEGHETEDPEQEPNSFSTDIFDGANVHSLTVVSQPVAEITTWSA